MADLPPMHNALAQRPIMPEEYDRQPMLGDAQPHAEAFGAGVIDPMGLPSWLLNKLVNSHTTDWYQRWAQEKRDQSPVAAGVGSAVPTLSAGLYLQALRNAPLFARMGMSVWPALGKDMLTVGGPASVVGGAAGKLREAIAPPDPKQRPQAAYPPDGAY